MTMATTGVVLPFRRPGPPPKTGIPPHIKAELARLKEEWAAQRATEAQAQTQAQDRLELEELKATRTGPQCEPGRWLPAWAIKEAEATGTDGTKEHTG